MKLGILEDRIVYDDHVVRLRGDFSKAFKVEYLYEMSRSLSDNGSAEVHFIELERMNNDGSWVVEPK